MYHISIHSLEYRRRRLRLYMQQSFNDFFYNINLIFASLKFPWAIGKQRVSERAIESRNLRESSVYKTHIFTCVASIISKTSLKIIWTKKERKWGGGSNNNNKPNAGKGQRAITQQPATTQRKRNQHFWENWWSNELCHSTLFLWLRINAYWDCVQRNNGKQRQRFKQRLINTIQFKPAVCLWRATTAAATATVSLMLMAPSQ